MTPYKFISISFMEKLIKKILKSLYGSPKIDHLNGKTIILSNYVKKKKEKILKNKKRNSENYVKNR